jgi:hypothetical protein
MRKAAPRTSWHGGDELAVRAMRFEISATTPDERAYKDRIEPCPTFRPVKQAEAETLSSWWGHARKKQGEEGVVGPKRLAPRLGQMLDARLTTGRFAESQRSARRASSGSTARVRKMELAGLKPAAFSVRF